MLFIRGAAATQFHHLARCQRRGLHQTVQDRLLGRKLHHVYTHAMCSTCIIVVKWQCCVNFVYFKRRFFFHFQRFNRHAASRGRKKRADSFTYQYITVGDDEECGEQDIGEACNGPVREGTSYQVSLATCTQGGCAVTPYADGFETGTCWNAANEISRVSPCHEINLTLPDDSCMCVL